MHGSALDLNQVDLNLLVALDTLLKERNVTRAGRRMGLSQPAMSATLGRLRTLLGDTLLERVGREYRLTPLAQTLSKPVEGILASIERTLEHNSAFSPATVQRNFRIAASDYVLFVLFPTLVERVARLAPGIRLHFQQVDTRIAQQLTARRVDISIQPKNLLRGFATQELLTDSWVCVASRDNPEIGSRITREQLCSLPHASYSMGDGSSFADRFVGTATGNVHVRVTCQSFAALPLLLRGTNLVAVVQRLLAMQLAETADIRVLEPPIAIPKLVLSMWWNPISTPDPAHAWLREIISEVARELSPAADTAPMTQPLAGLATGS
jgi:DNA-binding transcriptional LysR family regulator